MINVSHDSQRRRRAAIAAATVVLMGAAGALASTVEGARPLPPVDLAQIAGLVLLALVVGVRATTNFSLAKRDPAMDDELTQANRASASRAGFWAFLLSLAVALIASVFVDFRFVEITPVLIAVGAAGAGLRFAILEARGDG
ncbi:MAG: hypothetical protein R3C30_02195 [Hyphomonadaceae bacterium]